MGFAVGSTILVLTIVTYVLSYFGSKSLRRNSDSWLNSEEESENIVLIVLTENEKKIKALLTKVNPYLKAAMRVVKQMKNNNHDRMRRRSSNRTFLQCLTELYGSLPEAMVWLKNSMDEDVAAMILEDQDKSESWTNKVTDALANRLVSFGTRWNKGLVRRQLTQFILRFFLIANCYLDLILDIALLAIILTVKGSYRFFQFDSFTSQLILVLAVSIVLPHLKSALTTAYQKPIVPLGYKIWLKHVKTPIGGLHLLLIRVGVILLYPLVPALILNNAKEIESQRANLERRLLQQPDTKHSIALLDEINHRSMYLDETRQTVLIYKRNELFIEIMIQLPVHIGMLLLSTTDYPLENGLQAVFKKSDHFKTGTVFLLIFSSAWSLKTVTLTYVKIKTAEKQYLKLAAKVVLAIRATVVICVRLVCYIAYFAPFLGLGGLMNHFLAEQIPMGYNTLLSMKSLYFYFWNKDRNVSQSIAITDVYRSD